MKEQIYLMPDPEEEFNEDTDSTPIDDDEEGRFLGGRGGRVRVACCPCSSTKKFTSWETSLLYLTDSGGGVMPSSVLQSKSLSLPHSSSVLISSTIALSYPMSTN